MFYLLNKLFGDEYLNTVKYCNDVTKYCDLSFEEENEIVGWKETASNYYLVIDHNEPEISVDNNKIYIDYEFKSNVNNKRVNVNKVLTFPQNSNPETLKAKAIEDKKKILITVEKKNPRKKITIE